MEETKKEIIQIVKTMVEILLLMEEETELEASITLRLNLKVKWHSVSIFIPNDFKSVEPVSTSFFQIYEKGEGPRLMLRPKVHANYHQDITQ